MTKTSSSYARSQRVGDSASPIPEDEGITLYQQQAERENQVGKTRSAALKHEGLFEPAKVIASAVS